MTTARKGAAPRRSPPTGGYARGEEQRARIIRAGLKVFGDQGYEGASTRRIAKEAGVQPPALQYYFDSKEGLNRACAEFAIENANRLLKPLLEVAEDILRDATPQTAIEALCDLLDAMVDTSLLAEARSDWARFSAQAEREADSPAGILIRARVAAPIYDICGRLVACVVGSPPDDKVWLRTGLIVGQTSAFNFHREITLLKLGWADFEGWRRDAAKSVLRSHTMEALKLRTT